MSPPDTIADVDRLRRALETLRDGHRRLRGCLGRKREAIRTADLAAMTGLCDEEHALIERLREAERQRVELLDRLGRRLLPGADGPPTLRQLADALAPPLRGPLLAVADELRAEVTGARRESAVVADAARALSRHVAGVLQSVQGALTRVGVYERRGRLATGAPMQFCVDLRS